MWRVIGREGLEQASVRNVAKEAGLSVGSLRHYFATQTELLNCTLGLVGDRLEARLTAAGTSGDAVKRVQAKIEEMLPIDAERRLECEIWLAFTARSLVDETLRETQCKVDQRLSGAFDYLIGLLVGEGRLAPGLNARDEAERLYALVDGLIVHALVRDAKPAVVRRVVINHLRQITTT